MNAMAPSCAITVKITLSALACGVLGCREPATPQSSSSAPATSGPAAAADAFAKRRAEMVEAQLRSRDIVDARVLAAMGRVPRHRFVGAGEAAHAYEDRPLPIGEGQTISQPYIVALMTQLAEVEPGDRVLDVGTGSGYQAAVLAEVGARVWSVEIVPELAAEAKGRLRDAGYAAAVEVRAGDGYRGWPEHAPFAAVIVAAAAPRVPEPLFEQLAPGGKLVLPVGEGVQELLVITKQPDGTTTRQTVAPVMFVPMTGEVRGAGGPSR